MTALLTEIHVPAKDGAVQQAFERLDAQMDAWLAALKRLDAHSRTAEAVQQVSPMVSPTVSAVQAPELKPLQDVPAQVAQVAQTHQSAEQQEQSVVQDVKPESASVPESGVEPVGIVATNPEELDGDALLATLDEETAKDIRVMRRMTFGKRSVRELLAEYQTKKIVRKSGEQAGKSKSWWRR